MTNPLVALGRLGPSFWHDFITHDLMASGADHRLIEQGGASGMTGNPTRLEHALSGSSEYERRLLSS